MRALGALAAALMAGPVAGQVVSPAPDRSAVTVYRLDGEPPPDADVRLDEMSAAEGLAMIRETRFVDLPAGRSRISFRGVADTMIPQTAAVEGLPGTVTERNQDYDLLTPGALVEAAVGRPVRLIRTNPRTGEAIVRPARLRAGAAGPVLEVDGRIEGLGCSGAPERLVFDEIPPGLADKPTFSVIADAPRAGRYEVRLSYLATGMGWSADYVARLAPDGRTLDLIGWVTLANQTSSSFVDAPTDVVAGNLERDEDETKPPHAAPLDLRINCWPPAVAPPALPPLPVPQVAYRSAPGAPGLAIEELVVTAGRMAAQSELGDYKLYTLPEPTTVAARQTKQVLFLEQKGVPFERVYAFRFDPDEGAEEGPRRASVLLRLRNEKAAGLGKPLPAGAVAVMEPGPGGAPVLVGQRRVKDTPVGLPLEVELGRALDVSVSARVVDESRSGGRERRTVEAVIANDKPVAVAFEFRQAAARDGFRLERASRRAGTKNGDPFWTFRLRPGERASLRYEVSSGL